MQDDAFDSEYKPNGDKLARVFFDDTHAGDNTPEKHVATLRRILTVARKDNIQYRLEKCLFFFPEVPLIGCICGKKGRRVAPKKVQQLRDWPAYTSCKDISSHLAFANYLQ